MQKLAVIGDEHLVLAYRMLGAETFVAHTAEEMMEILKELLAREDIGVILVTRDLVEPVMEDFSRIASRVKPPIVSILPTMKAPGEPVDMRKLLMKALGVGG